MKFKFNPTIDEYLGNNKEKSIFNLAWSLVWRGVVLFWGIVFAAYFCVGFYEGLMGI